MVRNLVIISLLGILLLAACGLNAQSAPSSPAQNAVLAPIPNAEVADGAIAKTDLTAAVQPVEKRIVLKNAALTLVVEDAEQILKQIAGMAEEMSGWVVTSNTNKVSTPAGGNVIQGTITIRVPADKLDDALNQIKSGAISVESESVTGQDVTQDYVDLTSQLNNLKAAETQLQTIMEGAQTTDNVLSVYNELVRVRGEIETTQGRIRYYDESAAYSSISVTAIPQAIETPIQIAGWSPGRTAENALAALINVLRFAADLLITVLILVAPLVLIFGVPGWLIYRMLLRRGIISPRPSLVKSATGDVPPEA